MGTALISLGVVCILGAIVGGGLKALGTELPALQSIARQAMLAVFGIVLVIAGAAGNQTSQTPQRDTGSTVGTTTSLYNNSPPQPPDPSACLAGDWLEALKERPDDASPNHWSFEPSGDTLTITRADNFIKGDMKRNGATWTGTLTFGNGNVWSNVTLTPSADCKLVQTNQQWYYRR